MHTSTNISALKLEVKSAYGLVILNGIFITIISLYETFFYCTFINALFIISLYM